MVSLRGMPTQQARRAPWQGRLLARGPIVGDGVSNSPGGVRATGGYAATRLSLVPLRTGHDCPGSRPSGRGAEGRGVIVPASNCRPPGRRCLRTCCGTFDPACP
ncbi:hypothetical protein GCM10009858_00960 [Terrabacter carboxydivorans]|uniref:Uncharacterized protein n=1 Tax=Terrabacter carboxydivorans TaxID=619730 RepID=A0ABP5XT05_9MICO